MRAVVMRAVGDPSVLRVEECPVPVAGPHQALLRVGAVGVSYHDVVERNGVFRGSLHLPAILGNEIAGTVVALGELVSTLKIGDRVCAKGFSACGRCRFCRNGMETACPDRKVVHGGYAEYTAVDEEALVGIPDAVSFSQACSLGSAIAVALHAVRDAAKVKLNESVLVTGATGGVGLPAVEIAKAAGAIVIAVTRSDAKRQALLDAGADHVVLLREGQDFTDEVRALTEGQGVDVVIDNVGSRVFTPSFRSLAVGGRYAFVGQLFREDIAINPARIFFKRATLIGVASARRDHIEDAARLIVAGKVHPRVARVFPLEEADRAHAMVEAGEATGRVVLHPTPEAG